MPKLLPDEVRAFLAEPGHLVRLATVDDDGAPHVVPIWFVFENDRIWITPASDRRGGDTCSATSASRW